MSKQLEAAIEYLADRLEGGHLLASMGGEDLLRSAADEIDALRDRAERAEADLAAEKARWGELRARLYQLAPFDRDAAIEALDHMDATHPLKAVRVVVESQTPTSDTDDTEPEKLTVLAVGLPEMEPGDEAWLVPEVSDA